MNNEIVLSQMDLIRSFTLRNLEHVSEADADKVPSGFRNTIRWNAGHIVTVQEQLVIGLGGGISHIPSYYPEMFGNGTKPEDWKREAPTMDELLGQLKEQPGRIRAVLGERLGENAVQPFKLGQVAEMNTIGEILIFSLYHEGIHAGTINAMKKLLTDGA